MKEATRILIVEDLESDYTLARREIRKAVKNCSFEWVAKQGDFLKALEDFQPDLILSDYILPDFDGLKVLKLSQKYAPSTPIVLWSGSVGESVAVDCLKRGASNFILKENLKQLGPAIRHALDERKLLLENKRAEEKYRAIFENSMEGIFQSTPDGRYLSVNPAMARIYGYESPTDMIETITDISRQLYVEPQVQVRFTELLQTVGSVENFEAQNFRKDGRVIWTSTSARIVRDGSGRVLYYEGFLQDITRRKEMEERLQASESRYRLATQATRDVIWEWTPDANQLLWTDNALSVFGYSSDEVGPDALWWDERIHPQDRDRVVSRLNALVAEVHGESAWSDEYRFRLKDGSYAHVSDHAYLERDSSGRTIRMIGAISDITERKQAQEDLANSEKRFRALIENGLDSISLLAVDGTLLWESPAVTRILDYAHGEFYGRNIFELLHPDDRAWTQELYLKLVQEPGSRQHRSFRLRHSHGSWRWVEAVVTNMLDEPSVNAIVVNYRDITERKQAEQALLESQAKYRNLVETSHDLIWSIDPQGRFTFVNQAARSIYGYEPEELIGRSFLEILDPESYDHRDFEQLLQSITRVNEFREVETHVRHRDGRKFILSANSIMLRDADGNVTGVTGSSHDITLRKRVEDVLTEERNLLRTLIDNLPDRIYAMDTEGRKILSNRADWQASGAKTMEEVIGKTDFELYPVELAQKFWQLARKVLESGQPVINQEEPGLDATGNPVSILTSKIPLRDSNGRVIGLVGIGRDITERKQVEDRLREGENRLIMALSAAQMSVWEWNLNTNDVLWSPEFYAVTGITESAFDGTFEGYTDLIHPGDVARVREAAERAVADNTMFGEEFRIIRPDGEVRWLSNLGHAEYGQSSTSLRMIGTVQDITQRKQVEVERQALLEIMQGLARTEDLQEFLELIHHSIARVIYAENFFVVFHDRDTGLFEEIYSVDQYDPPAPPSKLEKSITSHVFRSGEPLLLNQELFDELVAQGEVELIGTNSASWLGTPLKTINETIGVMVVQDYENPNRYSERDRDFLASIASQVALALERKQADERVRESEERYRALFEDSPLSIWEEDFSQVKKYLDALKLQGITDFRAYFTANPHALQECAGVIKILDANNAALRMYQAGTKQELLDGTMHNLSQGEQEHNLEDFIAIAEGRTGNSWEGGDKTLIGKPIDVSLKWSVAPGHEQDFSKVIVTVIDITERKRAEEAEREQRALAEALRDTAEILSSTLDYGEVLDHILSAVERVVPHEAATIMLIEGDNARVVRSRGYGERGFSAEIRQIELPLTETSNLRQILETRQPVVVSDTRTYAGWRNLLVNEWLRSNLGAPISIYGEVIGFILLDSGTPGFFTPFHAERLGAFANQAALAIHNARLLKQAQDEIAERRQAEETLRIEREKAQKYLDIAGVIMLALDRDGTITLMNQKGSEILDYPADQILGKNWVNNFLPEGIRDEMQAAFQKLINGSADISDYYENNVLRRNGEQRLIAWHNTVIRNSQGEIIGTLSSGEDITERKRAEQGLYASEERFRQLAENIEEVFWMTDARTGQELYMSPASEKVWGLSSEHVMQEPNAFLKSILPEDKPLVLRGLEREKNGEKVEMEYRITRPDGSIRWIWDRAFPVFDENGQVKILAGIAADITARKQVEQALRESENKAKALLNALPDLMFRMDREGTILDYKAESRDLYAQAEPTLMHRKIREVSPAGFADLIDRYIQQTLESGEMQVFEYQLTIPGRGLLDYEARMVTSGRDEVTAVVRDITERKQAEARLRESEERFSNAFEFAPIGIALVSLEGRFLKVNRSLCNLLGYREQELVTKTFQGITHPEDLDADLNYVNQLLTGKSPSYQMEKRYFDKSGSVVWVLLSVSLLKDGDGTPQYFIAQIQDISQRKSAEEQSRRRAEETSALLETSLALTNLDLNAILQSIGNSAKSLFTADGCRIFLMQPDGESLRCVLALQENFDAFSDLRVRLGQGVTGAVAASGRGEIVNDMQNDSRAVQVPGTLDEEEAIMFAPLRERDRTIGVLSVRRAGRERPFEPTDLELLEAFASMAASAVSNARLFEETQRRLAELEALYENGLAVGQLLEPHQIGERIIETFARHLSWHHVAIRLVRPGTDELELIAFNQPGLSNEKRTEIERHFNTMINRVGQGLSGWVVQTGKPIRTGNVLEHPQYVHTYSGIQSGLYMPLSAGERVIGVISVESEEPDAMTGQDERLLATLANQAAIAFENARLYQSAQQEIAERKRIEEELRESQERYQLLIETSPDGILMMGMDGTIRFCNGQMAGLFDLESPSELIGANIVSLFAPEEREHIELNMSSQMLDDGPQEGHWLMRRNGSRFFGELRSSGLRNDKGEQYAMIAQLRDVTERKQSQEALREERQRFLDLFENSPNPTWLEDFTAVIAWMDELKTQGVRNLSEYLRANPEEYKAGVSLIRILNVNHAAVIVNGARNKQELIDKVHELMLDETPSEVMMNELDMIWQGHTSFGFEMSSHRVDGSLITGIQRIYIPINNDRPDYARVIVTSTDITERVEMERRLRASELHYRELADSITDVLFELDHDLHYTHWNKASEMLMGIPAYEAIGKSMYEIFGESQEQIRIGKIYRSVLDENEPKTFETEILLHGQKFVFEINANPSTRGVSVVARNITERKLSETLMQKRFELVEYSAHQSFEEVLQKTIDVASDLTDSHVGFMHFIEDDQTTIHLQAWSTETLRDFCNAEGQRMHYPVDRAGVWADAVRQRRSLIHNDYESLSNKKGMPDGHVKLIREMVIPIIRNDRIVALLGVGNKMQEYTRQDIETAERFADYAWDITERKQMESALAEERNQLARRVEERTADLSRANSNLARALRVKDEFLANMSHELRTPLNAILGLSESLGEQVAGPLNEKQQKYLSTINESGHHLLSLINDILDLAKIEAGQITLDINKVDVNSVCQASLRMIKQLAQKKHQEVVFEIDHDLGLMWADERRLKQMIVNLLSNAVKFTPESAKIGLEVRGDRAANKVIITVWDTGIGIREQDLERLFKPFVQLDSGLAREATGTGLGLALVAQMARLHGGSVHALSEPGKGSRFIIQLPWEPALASDIVARLRNTGKFRAIDPGANRPTILLIEDTREVVMMLVDYLEMAGYKMVTAQDGIDGLAQAKLNRPDLILMDIQMPRMDGFEATQKLRSDSELRDIPIIALTALAMPNDRQRCLDAGMDEYMSKPINLKALAKTIQKLLYQEADPV